MRIRVTVTLDVDPDAWSVEYGVDRAKVREDARSYLTNGIRDHLQSLGLTMEQPATDHLTGRANF